VNRPCENLRVPTRDKYHAGFARDAREFTELLRSNDLSWPVPSCPGWSVKDLAEHLGGVHRWARDAILLGRPNDREQLPGDRDTADWFEEGAHELLALLQISDPEAAAWTFGPDPKRVAFWDRRQALETMLHLWDGQTATGMQHGIDSDLAADGVAEVVEIMYPRQVRSKRIAALPFSVRIIVTDQPEAEYVLGGDGVAALPEAVATLSGSAVDLLLALWGRGGVERLNVIGDSRAAAIVLTGGITP
jgi:uncharacterized protein (TIGR03083 family)